MYSSRNIACFRAASTTNVMFASAPLTRRASALHLDSDTDNKGKYYENILGYTMRTDKKRLNFKNKRQSNWHTVKFSARSFWVSKVI